MDEFQLIAQWIGWPVIVAGLIVFGGFVFWLQNNRIETLKDRLEATPNKENSVLCDECGFQIVSPSGREQVPSSFAVSGVFKNLPRDRNLWLFIRKSDGNTHEYWPQTPLTINRQSKTWHSKVAYLAGTPGSVAEIVVCAVGPQGETLINYYYKAGRENRRWPSIIQLTTDIVECASVQVLITRKTTK